MPVKNVFFKVFGFYSRGTENGSRWILNRFLVCQAGLLKNRSLKNLEKRSMLLLLSSMNTWAAQNSSWSAHIIVSEVSCGPWNAQVGWQVAYLDLKLRFTVSICNLPANLRIPRATLDFRKNDVLRSWTVSCSPCIHFVSEEEHWKTIQHPLSLLKKRKFF